MKCDYAHRYFFECWTEVTASKVEFLFIANSRILYMSPYTSGDHQMGVVLACIIAGMKPSVWLLLEANVKGIWRVEQVTEKEGFTAQMIQLFPTVITALNICTSSVLLMFSVYVLHSFDFLLSTMLAKRIVWSQSLCHVIKL